MKDNSFNEMLRLDFPEVEVPRKNVPIDILEEKMKISADVGDNITDIRLCMVVSILEDEDRISVILPGARMDGPYNIPIENVREIERGPNGESPEHYVDGATVGQKEVDEDIKGDFEEAEEAKREQEHVDDGILSEEKNDEATDEDDNESDSNPNETLVDDVDDEENVEQSESDIDENDESAEEDAESEDEWDDFESEDEEDSDEGQSEEKDAWSAFEE